MHTVFKKIIAYTVLSSFAFFPMNLFEKKEKKWFPFYVPWHYCKGSQLDFSFLLDAPAGKHGFLTVKDGHFYFEDGTRARFWGLNIHSSRACFPTHRQAEDVAKRLAQLGCNIVRMHFLDFEDPDGVIATDYEDSQHLSERQMERLDYFIYQLKQNGIYVCFDVFGLGARRFKEGDGVVDVEDMARGARGISFFNERIKELSKKFALDFLSHLNPYTGLRYLDEPAIAFVEMANESSMFAKRCRIFPEYYTKEIKALWEKWLIDKERDSIIAGDWSKDREFLYELADKYQKDMYKYLRSIGVNVPIGSSNVPYDNLTLLADREMDFTDIHVYWDLCDRLDKVHNRPLIKQNHLNPRTIINIISIAKLSNSPLISTEWGSNWPNEWRAVDILTTASYAALNDWDALFLYSYNGGWDLSWDNLEKKLYYGTVIFNDPAKMGLFSTAALIFLRGDVKGSSETHVVDYPIELLFKMDDVWPDRLKLAGAAYISRLEKGFYRNKDKEETSEINYPNLKGQFGKDTKLVSDTGEIARDFKKGIFTLKTARAFSFSGFLDTEKKQEFQGVRFSTETDFGTFTIVSLTEKEISSSERLLLVVVGRAQNTGQRLLPHATKSSDDLRRDVYILDTGDSPILVESIKGRVFVEKGEAQDGLKVFALDEEGRRRKEVPVMRLVGGEYSFDISGEHETIYYELVKDIIL